MSKNTPDASFTTLHTYETKSTITLQFNHDALQSTMRKSDPFALEFEYTQVMMAFMVLYESLAHVLLIGLGGGSLSKFCYKYLPQSKITTIEINPEVIAHRHTFCIPPNRGSYHVGVKSAIFAASSQRKTKKTLKPTCYDFLLLANTR